MEIKFKFYINFKNKCLDTVKNKIQIQNTDRSELMYGTKAIGRFLGIGCRRVMTNIYDESVCISEFHQHFKGTDSFN